MPEHKMTIKELYEAAMSAGAENYTIGIDCEDCYYSRFGLESKDFRFDNSRKEVVVSVGFEG